jgi:hypothetical protein
VRRLALIACFLLGSGNASATGAPRIEPDGAPTCGGIFTSPPLQSVTASIDASGVLHLVVRAYVHNPLGTSVAVSGKDVRVELASSGVDEGFCAVPLRVIGAPSRPLDVDVEIRRGAHRPTSKVATHVP